MHEPNPEWQEELRAVAALRVGFTGSIEWIIVSSIGAVSL